MYKIILKFPFNNTIEKTSLIQYNKVLSLFGIRRSSL